MPAAAFMARASAICALFSHHRQLVAWESFSPPNVFLASSLISLMSKRMASLDSLSPSTIVWSCTARSAAVSSASFVVLSAFALWARSFSSSASRARMFPSRMVCDSFLDLFSPLAAAASAFAFSSRSFSSFFCFSSFAILSSDLAITSVCLSISVVSFSETSPNRLRISLAVFFLSLDRLSSICIELTRWI